MFVCVYRIGSVFGPWKDRPENFRSLRGKVHLVKKNDGGGGWAGRVGLN